jgi:small subunit ribosomal protein S18
MGMGMRRKKVCQFCADRNAKINYKDTELLSKFVTERGKILPSRVTGTCAIHQREIANAIKRARIVALMPYVKD